MHNDRLRVIRLLQRKFCRILTCRLSSGWAFTLPAEDPAHKLADLQSGLLFVLNDFFSHLDNVVDVESGAAYNDVIWLLKAMMPTGEAMAGIKKTVEHHN